MSNRRQCSRLVYYIEFFDHCNFCKHQRCFCGKLHVDGIAMDTPKKDIEFYAKNRAAWRKWLEKHHAKEPYVWLILYSKDSGTSSVTYAEAVEEALCFGWIDSKPNKRDAGSWFQFFCPRKPKSVWSALNKTRIKRLIEEGKMTPAGMAKIELAKQNGSWTALDAIEALEMPLALQKAFSKNKKALKNFETFPASAKKGIYQWVQSAKTEATRDKRVQETVSKAAEGKRANEWKKKEN